MAQVGQKSETWKQKRANMRASVSMRVKLWGGERPTTAYHMTFTRSVECDLAFIQVSTESTIVLGWILTHRTRAKRIPNIP